MKKIILIIFTFIIINNLNAVDLVINYYDGTSVVKSYPENTEKIQFLYGNGYPIIEIKGLENFTNLKELWLATTRIQNFDFLTQIKNLEILAFQDIKFINIEFIYEINTLKRLIFQSCKVNEIIDGSRLPGLEYFEFTNAGLTEFPILITGKSNIDTINIVYNKISTIPDDIDTNILIIAVGNPIQSGKDTNVVTKDINGSIYFLLPEKYRQYLR